MADFLDTTWSEKNPSFSTFAVQFSDPPGGPLFGTVSTNGKKKGRPFSGPKKATAFPFHEQFFFKKKNGLA